MISLNKMNYTEEQITKTAKKVLKDLKKEYYNENCIDSIKFGKDKELSLDKFKGHKISCWTIFIKSLFDNLEFLIISDETGESIYYQNFNYITREIGKDEEGKYYGIKN